MTGEPGMRVMAAPRRFAAVLARRVERDAPAGIEPEAMRLALLEDTYETAAALSLVTAALALCPGDQPAAEALTWPTSPVLRIEPSDDATEVLAVLRACGALGATEAVVIAPDCPDLPQLVLGKLYRGLGSAEVAVCPAARGGLVALASRLPVSGWLLDAGVGLDTSDALDRLAAAAPDRRMARVGPGWHRLRRLADLELLDPGLEGWDATRALLAPAAH